MNSAKRVLVLFENLQVRREPVQYATALAERIGARVVLLMLLPSDFGNGRHGADLQHKGELVLAEEAKTMVQLGIENERVVRIGDPKSEFYKFLASRPSFQTVVWGGDENVLARSSGRTTDHWVSAIHNDLYCPLVIPRKR